MESGRKISREYENIVDNVLIDISEKLNPFYKEIGITPNILTTISLVVTIYGVYIYHKAKCNSIIVYVGVLLYFVGYYFDCADGNMARRYKMTSKFGDYYDHISDLCKLIITFYILYKTVPKNKFHYYLKTVMILILLMSIQFGCQELIYGKKDESPYLNMINLCKFSKDPKSTTKITKYFGAGTVQVAICIMLLYAKVGNCKLFKKSR